ncbi:MAG: hypothetical protein SVS85_02850 [Candidatus Nanohaloarchaea archaeon]|nr:hypothetical protein [Candidatus Nanohaloarchaea archaeon]
MGGMKKLVAGAVMAGAGKALEYIGKAIFTATGATEGPFLSYKVLIGLSSTGLIVLGALTGLYGFLEGVYTLWKKRKEEDGEEGGEENGGSRNSRPRTSPSSRRDRPSSPSRQ